MALPTSQFCAWRVLLDKLPTYENLLKMGSVVNDHMCIICQAKEEIISHLFFTCKEVSKIWYMYDLWIGVKFVHH